MDDKKKTGGAKESAFGSSITFVYSAEVEKAINTILRDTDEAPPVEKTPEPEPERAPPAPGVAVEIYKLQEIYQDALTTPRKALPGVTINDGGLDAGRETRAGAVSQAARQARGKPSAKPTAKT